MPKGSVTSFLSRERSRFLSYARALIKDTNIDPEDVVQDVFVKLLERGDRPAPEYLAAYTYRSLKNRVTDLYRTRRADVEFDEEDDSLIDILEDILEGKGALEEITRQERQLELFQALETLSDIERSIVIANELEGAKLREVAETFSLPLNTVLSHKSRAMKKLRKTMTRKSL